jgi:23S rRNA pseudouridine1911/1915/1917 synthase
MNLEIIVALAQGPKIRLDSYLREQYPEFSRSSIHDLIQEKLVWVNGEHKKPSYIVKHGDNITIRIPRPQKFKVEPENIPVDIIYEDESIIVVNKPSYMVVHPARGNPNGTLVNALLKHCGQLSRLGGETRLGIVHRLDKGTSGIMVVAKKDTAHLALAKQFKERNILKIYNALVWGNFKEREGEISLPIGRSLRNRTKMAVSFAGGREATTSYKVIEELKYFSFTEIYLHTGRTHQIRVHLKHINHPIIGDTTYGIRKKIDRSIPCDLKPGIVEILSKINRQALHARFLGFTHPDNGAEMQFEAPLPNDISMTWNNLREVCGTVN